MAAIYSNGGNRWNILGFNFTKRDALSSEYKISMNLTRNSCEKSLAVIEPAIPVQRSKAKKKICGFPVSRPYLAFGRRNPDPKLFYWIMLVSVST
jgi:hypothetical protein